MSARSDNILSLCLEQAAKSPLHYRHGCVVVRGGKVIGHGFNDLRSGFNGGALKTGQIAAGKLDGPALLNLKSKLKRKTEPVTNGTFTPFEQHSVACGMGGGPHANTPLTMHSEMMAIHSAIAASSTLDRSATSFEKPCWKLPADSKRKERLRRNALNATVPPQAPPRSLAFKSGILNHVHLNQINKSNNKNDNKTLLNEGWKKQNGNDLNDSLKLEETLLSARPVKDTATTLTSPQRQGVHLSGHHAHHQPRRYQDQCQHEYGNCSSKAPAQSKLRPPPTAIARSRALQPSKKRNKSPEVVGGDLSTTRSDGPSLLPTGKGRQIGTSLRERMKYSRLNGADLYVARFGGQHAEAGEPIHHDLSMPTQHAPRALSPSSASTRRSLSPPASLHDELTCVTRELGPDSSLSSTRANPSSTSYPRVLESRPCYRCITYMHNVGVRRVFWTNMDGAWEGAKVRDLMDTLDGVPDTATSVSGQTKKADIGMFVTKHEVLMLRRVMGAKQSLERSKPARRMKKV